jgi:hypothetical protein
MEIEVPCMGEFRIRERQGYGGPQKRFGWLVMGAIVSEEYVPEVRTGQSGAIAVKP